MSRIEDYFPGGLSREEWDTLLLIAERTKAVYMSEPMKTRLLELEVIQLEPLKPTRKGYDLILWKYIG